MHKEASGMHIETRPSRVEVTYLGKDNSAAAGKRKPEAVPEGKLKTTKLQGSAGSLRRAWP